MKRLRLRTLCRGRERLQRRLRRLEACSQRYSRLRALIVLGGIIATLVAGRTVGHGVEWIVAGTVVVLFSVVATYHGRLKHSMRKHAIWLGIKSTHRARMTLDWAQLPAALTPDPEAGHPFAADLNLTGDRSLHHLLDTSFSREGSARLADWLLHPLTDAAQIRARQDLLQELIPLARFRDRLALQSALVVRDAQQRWEGESLRQWLARPEPPDALTRWLIGLGALAGLNLMFALLDVFAGLPAWWVLSWLVYLTVYTVKHGELGGLFSEAFRLETTLQQFHAVAQHLEMSSYRRTPHLAALCAPFWRTEPRPSAVLKRLARLAGAASIQQGNLVGPVINAMVPWDLYFAHRFRRCKADVRDAVPLWLDTWHELEALSALATYGYLHPEYVFAEVQGLPVAARQPVLRAQALGHPLIPHAECVGNDFTLQRLGEVVLITGSNMSGKSTFLRTLGVNLCLALNGAPVRAASLRTIPFRLFTCMAISDSLVDGLSYFYAEVKRLKALLDALETTDPLPLFFLIDEIFRGTNNRERLIGSRAYIRALVGRQGVGVVSTHDLELVHLVDTVAGLRNAHFREDVVDRRMVFDYQLRAGPCPTTNALRIMRLAGLPMTTDSAENRADQKLTTP
jgi:hypothetical protein